MTESITLKAKSAWEARNTVLQIYADAKRLGLYVEARSTGCRIYVCATTDVLNLILP